MTSFEEGVSARSSQLVGRLSRPCVRAEAEVGPSRFHFELAVPVPTVDEHARQWICLDTHIRCSIRRFRSSTLTAEQQKHHHHLAYLSHPIPSHLTLSHPIPAATATARMTLTARFSPLIAALLCVVTLLAACHHQQQCGVDAFAAGVQGQGVQGQQSSVLVRRNSKNNKNMRPFVTASSRTSTISSTTTSLNAAFLGAAAAAGEGAGSVASDMMMMMSSSSGLLLSATTLDPTTFFQNVLGLFLNTPIILAVPIVAALGIAGTLVWLIVAYASPVEDN
jgi:hypothetical protein